MNTYTHVHSVSIPCFRSANSIINYTIPSAHVTNGVCLVITAAPASSRCITARGDITCCGLEHCLPRRTTKPTRPKFKSTPTARLRGHPRLRRISRASPSHTHAHTHTYIVLPHVQAGLSPQRRPKHAAIPSCTRSALTCPDYPLSSIMT